MTAYKDREIMRPKILETGPKPLATNDIEYNSQELKTGRVVTIGSKSSSFSSIGIFSITDRNQTYQPSHSSNPFWSEELLRFDPSQHSLRTNKYGNLEVHKTNGEGFIPAQARPIIILEAKDVRALDQVYIKRGEVRSSGFVFPKDFPRYPLGKEQEISPEDLEQMLLNAQKNDKPQASYSLKAGFVKVDPSLVGRDVLLLPFHVIYRDIKDLMKTDAVVIDLAQRKLLPRIFYTLNPKPAAH